MHVLTITQQAQLCGGRDAITVIGVISCTASTIWPIGTLIAGPTCAGMLIASMVD